MYFITKTFSHLDPLAALMRRQITGINVIPWHTGDQPGTEQGSERGKDKALIALFCNVVKKDLAQHIAGKRSHAAALKPGRLTRSRQTNSENNHAFGRPP